MIDAQPATMRTYRVYLIGRYGQYLAVKKFDAATDDEAVVVARSVVPREDMELWTGDRRVTLT